jgi:hypothetical protein
MPLLPPGGPVALNQVGQANCGLGSPEAEGRSSFCSADAWDTLEAIETGAFSGIFYPLDQQAKPYTKKEVAWQVLSLATVAVIIGTLFGLHYLATHTEARPTIAAKR